MVDKGFGGCTELVGWIWFGVQETIEIDRNFGIGSGERRERSKAVFVEQDFSCFKVSLYMVFCQSKL